MKIYYICEICEMVFSVENSAGPDGFTSVRGICDDCALEMGLKEDPLMSQKHFYH